MAEKLTPAQQTAVQNRGGKLLVSAAAGSGKTKVLVDRLMSYLTDSVSPANIDDFLIITYTKAAAAELRGKIADKITQYVAAHPENRHMQQQIQRLFMAKISTVHAFCADILREYAYKLDISADFRIAEENECTQMMQQVLDNLLDHAYTNRISNESFQSLVDTQGLGRDDRQVPEIILQIYSAALCHLNPDGWLEWCVRTADVADVTDAADTIWGRYLIDDFKAYLSQQIMTLEKCAKQAELIAGMEKPAALLRTTITDLRALQNCHTWDEIVSYPPVSYGTLTFTKEHRGSTFAEQIKAIRNNCKEGVAKKRKAFSDNSATVLYHLQQSFAVTEELIALVKEFRREFDKVKHSRRVLDFSDIEQKTLDLLLGKQRTGITAASREIGQRFREILVDEYQDSNEVQDAIFSALTDQNCFMVGDVKQSIYQFRLADPDIFLEKYNTYLPAQDAAIGQGRKVTLSSNFRSSMGVISAVNDVFKQCMSQHVGGLHYGEEEMLYEGLTHMPLPEPEVEFYGVQVQEDTYEEEARFTAQRIYQLLDGTHMIRDNDALRPITADDIVILLRSPGSVGNEFLFALEQHGIPCTMGNDSDLFLAPEIDAICALLQTIQNPLQDIPLIAAVSSPVFGFTADMLAQIRSKRKHGPFYYAFLDSALPEAQRFLSVLSQLRKDARFLTVTQLINRCYSLTQMLSVYGAMDDGEQSVRNLQSFVQAASNFESTGRKDLSYFLEYLDSMREQGLSISVGSSTGAVRIMSIHKSKGLEFPVVFLCGLSRAFNMANIQKTVLCHKDLGLGLSCVNQLQRVRFPSIAKRAIAAKITSESISEELRVLYVAMTRARDRLIMTYAAQKLADRMQDITLRIDMSDPILLSAHVNCPGSWILQTALCRTEAGALFNLAGYPDRISVQEHPWHIQVVSAPDAVCAADSEEAEKLQLSKEVLETIRSGLAFCYPHQNATKTPSKLTATQMKGRLKDQEASEFTDQHKQNSYSFRHPNTRERVVSGTEYGNALHATMQYLDFSKCTSKDSIHLELQKLRQNGILSEEQLQLIDASDILRFFMSDLGRKVINAKEILREFKFSVLENAQKFSYDTADDMVLLQGVIDCALIEDDGITIIDFKTDQVTDATVHERSLQYAPQVGIYADAISKIYEMPIKGVYLYFFRIHRTIEM